ncbi:MAG: YfhO family protein [Candidatus Gottesmanbacteria bacterium]|nr:YfhO family protein [Candidatus Gottesmanbacteria bacterium]
MKRFIQLIKNPYVILSFITLFFFWTVLIKGYVPFPGDLLLSEYNPWRHTSYFGYNPGSITNKSQYFDTISVCMYLYAKKIGISTVGSLFAAVILAYSSYMTDWLEFGVVGHTLAWFPLMLYALENLRSNVKIKHIIVLTLAISASLFAGYPMDFLFYFSFAILYWIYIAYVDSKTKKLPYSSIVIRALPCFAFSLLIGSIQLFPAIAYFLKSARTAIPYEFFINNMLVQPYQLVMTLIPDFFGNPVTKNYWLTTSYVSLTLSFGIASLLLASVFIFNLRKKDHVFHHREILFIACLLIIYILIVRTPLTELLYKINIPLFSTGSPTRLLTVGIFIWSILAGRGLDLYLKNKENLYMLLPVTLAFAAAWAGILFVPKTYQLATIRNTVYSSGIFIIVLALLILGYKKVNLKKLIVVLIILITILERFVAFQKFNPFIPKTWIYPASDVLTHLQSISGINRFYGYGTAKIESNIGTFYQLYSTDGYGAINYAFYNGFIRSSENGTIVKKFTTVNRSVAEIAPGYGKKDLPGNPYRLRILDALGVKYVLDRVENPQDNATFPQDRFKRIWDNTDGWVIYENAYAAPRYFLTDNINYYSTDKEFENIFFDPKFNPRDSILLEKRVEPHIHVLPSRNKHVDLISYKANTIIFRTNSDTPQILYISDTYDNGWKSFIDDKQVETLKANYALRAVYVPQGAHTIVMNYAPDEFTLGVIVTCTGLVSFIIYLLRSRRTMQYP